MGAIRVHTEERAHPQQDRCIYKKHRARKADDGDADGDDPGGRRNRNGSWQGSRSSGSPQYATSLEPLFTSQNKGSPLWA